MFKVHFDKHFTVDEARSRLPMLRRNLREIQRIFKELKEIGFDIYNGKYKPGFNPDTLEPHPYPYRRFLNLVQKILGEGIQIKSIEKGLIDFPALRSTGEEVFLCWKSDEDDIFYWHGLEEGFTGRQPIGVF
ncbi:MAG: DUF2203 domain-containing protein [Calditrichaeota bacterium]|nr:DUF2203 domain-containing protein [Calditrichota bacterium]